MIISNNIYTEPVPTVEVEANTDFKISPNPVMDIVNITFNSNNQKTTQLSGLNSLGQLVLTQQIIAGELGAINIADLESGIFFLQIVVNDKRRKNSHLHTQYFQSKWRWN